MSELRARLVEGPEDFRAVFDDMYQRGWTDGLPVIPPKPEYVQEMIEYNDLQPDDIVAEVLPEGAPATVQKVAINAVMAGCRNEYLPVLIAAVKAMAEPRFNLQGVQGTTNSVAPVLVINGPIRHKLDLNCGRGALGPGRRSNATIGRAIRLIMLNIGGGRPGEIDKATLGQPGKFTFCLGELEEETPWDPLHVELGFSREESTVSINGVQGSQSFRTPFQKAVNILRMTANEMAIYGNGSYNNGTGNPMVILTPGHAQILHKAGFSKSAVKEWLFENTKIPVSILPDEMLALRHHTPRVMPGEDRMCICEKPEDIVIVVAGSSEPYHLTHLPNWSITALVTKRIDTVD